jgi:carbon-monoxide dehydrogenase small subunit
VNGTTRPVEGAPTDSLLHVLRDRLGSRAKNACEQGECGSCSVLVDGVWCACLELAEAAVGCEITTVEASPGGASPATALAGDVLTDVQQAMVEAGASSAVLHARFRSRSTTC